ncbi:MAG: class I SAM-dependent methyltransferase [Gammaproteobacteria bacterium]|nr:class I SAM-dependent methyltransferase [Gammaproteobacteria bacterium]
MNGTSRAANEAALQRYYRFHARIYDATRWAFLFGRAALVDAIARHAPAPRNILEVGCGTGRNLLALGRRFPAAHLQGVDVSAAMLATARRRLARAGAPATLTEAAYDRPLAAPDQAFDVVLFSYCLSMINPGWPEALEAARADLAPGGLLAAVDFHHSPNAGFRRWMGMNHVRMEGQLLPAMERDFTTVERRVMPAYAGLWSYFAYLGRAG